MTSSEERATTSASDGARARTTRDDVARYAGVSAAVVSYVVNDGPRGVAAATRARVNDAIRALDYSPNQFARALKLGSTQTIGLIAPDILNPLFAEMAIAIEQVAFRNGHALLVANSAGDEDLEFEHLQNLAGRRVDGVVLLTPTGGRHVAELRDLRIPLVVLNGNDDLQDVTTVNVDLFGGARAGVQHLIDHGYVSIGLIAGETVQRRALEREQGWMSALQEAGLREGPVFRVPFSREGGYEAGQRLLRSAASPRAVFVSSDLQAIGVLRAMHENGVSVPGEMAIVSFDGSVETEYSWPPVTAVRQPIPELARAAIASLLEKKQSPNEDVHHVTLEGKLMIRESCGDH